MDREEHAVARGMNGNQRSSGSLACTNKYVNLRNICLKLGDAVEMSSTIAGMGELQDPEKQKMEFASTVSHSRWRKLVSVNGKRTTFWLYITELLEIAYGV